MRYILAALTALLALLAVVILAVSLTPSTVILAMVLLGAAGAFASFALFTEADDTTPADDTAGDLLIPNDNTPADIDGTSHLLDMMEATAATINPDDVDLFIYRPALNGGTRWTATLNDTHNRVITTITGDTETPGVVDVTHYYRELGKSDHFKNVNALRVAQELETDIPNIAAFV